MTPSSAPSRACESWRGKLPLAPDRLASRFSQQSLSNYFFAVVRSCSKSTSRLSGEALEVIGGWKVPRSVGYGPPAPPHLSRGSYHRSFGAGTTRLIVLRPALFSDPDIS